MIIALAIVHYTFESGKELNPQPLTMRTPVPKPVTNTCLTAVIVQLFDQLACFTQQCLLASCTSVLPSKKSYSSTFLPKKFVVHSRNFTCLSCFKGFAKWLIVQLLLLSFFDTNHRNNAHDHHPCRSYSHIVYASLIFIYLSANIALEKLFEINLLQMMHLGEECDGSCHCCFDIFQCFNFPSMFCGAQQCQLLVVQVSPQEIVEVQNTFGGTYSRSGFPKIAAEQV